MSKSSREKIQGQIHLAVTLLLDAHCSNLGPWSLCICKTFIMLHISGNLSTSSGLCHLSNGTYSSPDAARQNLAVS